MPVPKAAREILGDLFWSFNLDPMMNAALRPAPSANAFLTGIPCSPGQAEGRVVVVDRPEQLHLLEPGDILVCVGPYLCELIRSAITSPGAQTQIDYYCAAS
jgi:hypothetical protein